MDLKKIAKETRRKHNRLVYRYAWTLEEAEILAQEHLKKFPQGVFIYVALPNSARTKPYRIAPHWGNRWKGERVQQLVLPSKTADKGTAS